MIPEEKKKNKRAEVRSKDEEQLEVGKWRIGFGKNVRNTGSRRKKLRRHRITPAKHFRTNRSAWVALFFLRSAEKGKRKDEETKNKNLINCVYGGVR